MPLDPRQQQVFLDLAEKYGIVPPKEEGFFKETAQATVQGLAQSLRGVGKTFEEVGIPGGRFLTDTADDFLESNQQLGPPLGYSTLQMTRAGIGRTVGQALGSTAGHVGATLLGGFVGGAPGAIFAGTAFGTAQQYGETVGELREEFPDAKPEDLEAISGLVSVANALIEIVLGPQALAGKLGIRLATRKAASAVIRKSGWQLIRSGAARALKTGVEEAMEEPWQALNNELGRQMAGTGVVVPKLTWRDALEQTAGGFIGGTAIGAPVAGAHFAMDVKQQRVLTRARERVAQGDIPYAEHAEFLLKHPDVKGIDDVSAADLHVVVTKGILGLTMTDAQQAIWTRILPLSDQFGAMVREEAVAFTEKRKEIAGLLPALTGTPDSASRKDVARALNLEAAQLPEFLRDAANRQLFVKTAEQIAKGESPYATGVLQDQGVAAAGQAGAEAAPPQEQAGLFPEEAVTPTGVQRVLGYRELQQLAKQHGIRSVGLKGHEIARQLSEATGDTIAFASTRTPTPTTGPGAMSPIQLLRDTYPRLYLSAEDRRELKAADVRIAQKWTTSDPARGSDYGEVAMEAARLGLVPHDTVDVAAVAQLYVGRGDEELIMPAGPSPDIMADQLADTYRQRLIAAKKTAERREFDKILEKHGPDVAFRYAEEALKHEQQLVPEDEIPFNLIQEQAGETPEMIAAQRQAAADARTVTERTPELFAQPPPSTAPAPVQTSDLPDYARRAIMEESMGRRTEAGGIDTPDPYEGAMWSRQTVPVESLRPGNEPVWGPKFVHRGAVTEGPIVVDDQGIVIDGNNRLYEAIKRGDASIEAFVYQPPTAPPATAAAEAAERKQLIARGIKNDVMGFAPDEAVDVFGTTLDQVPLSTLQAAVEPELAEIDKAIGTVNDWQPGPGESEADFLARQEEGFENEEVPFFMRRLAHLRLGLPGALGDAVVRTTTTPRGELLTDFMARRGEPGADVAAPPGVHIVPDAELPPFQSRTVAVLRDLGVDLRFFDATPEYTAFFGDGQDRAGFMLDGVAFITSTATNSEVMGLLGHELAHVEASRLSPEEREAFMQALKTTLGPTDYAMVLRKVRGIWGNNLSPGRMLEEALGEANAQRLLSNPELLYNLAGRNPTLARRILDAVKRILRALIGDMRRFPHLWEGDTGHHVDTLIQYARALEATVLYRETQPHGRFSDVRYFTRSVRRRTDAVAAETAFGKALQLPASMAHLVGSGARFVDDTFAGMELGGRLRKAFGSVHENLRRAMAYKHFSREEAQAYVVEQAEKFGVVRADRELLHKHRENPDAYPIPERLEPVAEWIDATYARIESMLTKRGMIGVWPASAIQRNELRIADLTAEMGEVKTDKAKAKRQDEIANLVQLNEFLGTLRYARRFVTPAQMEKIEGYALDDLKSDPKRLLGRKFTTMDELNAWLEDHGGSVEMDAFAALADLIWYAKWQATKHDFHVYMRESQPDLVRRHHYSRADMEGVAATAGVTIKGQKLDDLAAQLEELAPAEWRAFQRTHPVAPAEWLELAGIKEYAGYRVHPLFYEAAKDYTEVGGPTSRAGATYDQLNVIAKQLKFYNFMVMSLNNLQQGFALGGFRAIINIPRGIKAVMTRSPLYRRALEADMMPTPSDLPTADYMTEVHRQLGRLDAPKAGAIRWLMDHAEVSSWGELFDVRHPGDSAKRLLGARNPALVLSRKLTWYLDRGFRMATLMAMLEGKSVFGVETKRKYTFDEAVGMVRNYHADYNILKKTPAKWMRRTLLTPAYQYAMWKRLFIDEMAAHPKRNAGPIMRVASMYMLGGAMAAYFGYAWVEGYRFVKKDEPDEETPEGRERVLLMFGPFAEPWKTVGRAVQGYTSGGLFTALGRVFYNKLAALPHMFESLRRNRDWRGRIIMEEGAPDSTNRWRLGRFMLHEIYPIVQQVGDWGDAEQDTFDNVLRLFTLTRFQRKPMQQYYENRVRSRLGKIRSYAKREAEKNPENAKKYFAAAGRNFADYAEKHNNAIRDHDARIESMRDPRLVYRLLTQFDYFDWAGALPQLDDVIRNVQLRRRLWEYLGAPTRQGRTRGEYDAAKDAHELTEQFFESYFKKSDISADTLREALKAEARRLKYSVAYNVRGKPRQLTAYGRRLRQLNKKLDELKKRQ